MRKPRKLLPLLLMTLTPAAFSSSPSDWNPIGTAPNGVQILGEQTSVAQLNDGRVSYWVAVVNKDGSFTDLQFAATCGSSTQENISTRVFEHGTLSSSQSIPKQNDGGGLAIAWACSKVAAKLTSGPTSNRGWVKVSNTSSAGGPTGVKVDSIGLQNDGQVIFWIRQMLAKPSDNVLAYDAALSTNCSTLETHLESLRNTGANDAIIASSSTGGRLELDEPTKSAVKWACNEANTKMTRGK